MTLIALIGLRSGQALTLFLPIRRDGLYAPNLWPGEWPCAHGKWDGHEVFGLVDPDLDWTNGGKIEITWTEDPPRPGKRDVTSVEFPLRLSVGLILRFKSSVYNETTQFAITSMDTMEMDSTT